MAVFGNFSICTGFYLEFAEFYWVSPGFQPKNRHDSTFLGPCTGFHWVILSFTEFYRVLPSFSLGLSSAADAARLHRFHPFSAQKIEVDQAGTGVPAGFPRLSFCCCSTGVHWGLTGVLLRSPFFLFSLFFLEN